MASVDEQTVGGLIATASHGSGHTTRSVSALVRKLHVVTARAGAPAYELHASGGSVLPEGFAPGCRGAEGEREEWEPEPSQEELARWFSSGRAGLGALGVVVAVQLECVPAYRLVSREFTVNTSHLFSAVASAHASDAERRLPDGEGLREFMRAYEFGKIWVLPHTGKGLMHGIERADETKHPWAVSDVRDASRWKEDLDSHLLEALMWLGARLPALQRVLNEVVFVAKTSSEVRRAGRSDRLQVIPFRVPLHTESEISVPACNIARLMRAFEQTMDAFGLTTGFIFELRFVAPDDVPLSPDYRVLGGPGSAWDFAAPDQAARVLRAEPQFHHLVPDEFLRAVLGPCADGSCRTCGAGAELLDVPRMHVTLGLHEPTEQRLRDFLGTFERLAFPLGGRPHWAKWSYASPQAIKANYPRFEDFRAAARAIDPKGILRNDFIRRTFDL
jgi:FAD/FMN-containing dehydrogenase